MESDVVGICVVGSFVEGYVEEMICVVDSVVGICVVGGFVE